MSEDLQLTRFANVTLDANGNGTVSLGPSVVREFWKPTGATVSVSTQNREASCSLYLGATLTGAQKLGATSTGSTGDTYGFADFEMVPGQVLFAQWSGGDAGATATLNVYGSKGRYGGRIR